MLPRLSDNTVTATKTVITPSYQQGTMAGCPAARTFVFFFSPYSMTAHSTGAQPHHNYGGDGAGLVCGYLMQGSTPAMPLDSTEAAHWLHAHGNDVEPAIDQGETREAKDGLRIRNSPGDPGFSHAEIGEEWKEDPIDQECDQGSCVCDHQHGDAAGNPGEDEATKRLA